MMTAGEVCNGRVFDTVAAVELIGRPDPWYYGPVWLSGGRFWALYRDRAVEVVHVCQNTYREQT